MKPPRLRSLSQIATRALLALALHALPVAATPTDPAAAVPSDPAIAAAIDPEAALSAGAAAPAPRAAVVANYSGLWWNAAESGWGINFSHQGDTVFATWFTYDAAGRPWWLIAVLNRTADGTYAGPVSTVVGPPFGSQPWDLARVAESVVGTMEVNFAAPNAATLTYTVNGISRTVAVTKQLFGPDPVCVWGLQKDLTLATNYQGLWWAGAAESGWGINLTHQGDTIFATWFTYDSTGRPWWLIAVLDRTGKDKYAGPVSVVSGPAFGSPWDATRVSETVVGSATLTFADGNHGTLSYTVNGISQSKAITRQVFAEPGTVCAPAVAIELRQLHVEEGRSELHLIGDFGVGTPRVWVAGIELPVVSSSLNLIVATLPLTGPGSSGDAYVEIGGARTGVRQLTEWSIPLTYTWSGTFSYPGTRFDGTGTLRLRADIGAFHSAPGEPLAFAEQVGAATKDSHLRVAGSGTSTQAGCTFTLAGTGTYVSQTALADGPQDLLLANAYSFDGGTRKAAIGLAFGTEHSPHTLTSGGKAGCPTSVQPYPAFMGLLDGIYVFVVQTSDEPQDVPMTAVTFSLDAGYGIPAVKRTATAIGGTLTVEWPTVPAKSPPR